MDGSNPKVTADKFYGTNQRGSSFANRVAVRPPPPKLTNDNHVDEQYPELNCTSGDKCERKSCVYDPTLNDDTLTMAVMVANCSLVTDDDSLFMPTGVEFDPDAKIKEKHKFRMRLLALVLVFSMAVLVVGVTGGMIQKMGRSDDQTPYRETLGIREEIQRQTGLVFHKSNTNVTNDMHMAMEWLLHKDPLELVPSNTTLLQRFALASIYFAATIDQEFAFCAPPSNFGGIACKYEYKISTFDTRRPLEQAVYYSTEVSGNRWLSGTSECTWAGVDCSTEAENNLMDYVQELNLNGMNLTGTFPSGVQFLPALQKLRLAYGQLRGPLPGFLPRMTSLETLKINDNHFTGPIPLSWYNEWSHLKVLDLTANQLEGPISSRISQWANIKDLFLTANRFTGPIPAEVDRLTQLEFLRFDHNQFSGSIPSTLGRLSSLMWLVLTGNLFSGDLPEELAQLTKLRELLLDSNPGLGGRPLPSVLFGMSDLLLLDLSSSQWTGTIPTEFGRLKGLLELNLRNNNLAGTVPTELDSIPSMYRLILSHNSGLHGTVGCIKGTVTISTDPLYWWEADCSIFPTKDNLTEWHQQQQQQQAVSPVLECSCCTICCQSGGTSCVPTNA